MTNIGIALDDWKLPIFEKALKKAGYNYAVEGGLSPGTKMLRVLVSDVKGFKKIIRKANNAAAKTRAH